MTILTSSYTLHHSRPSPYKLVNLPVRASLLGLILILHSKNLDCGTRQHCWNLWMVLFCQSMSHKLWLNPAVKHNSQIMTHKGDKTLLSTLNVHQYMPCFAFLLTIPWQMINHIRTIFADKFLQHFLKIIKLFRSTRMIPISARNSRIFGLKIDFWIFAWAKSWAGTYHHSEAFVIHLYLCLWLYMWNQEDYIHFQNWLWDIDDSWTVVCMF